MKINKKEEVANNTPPKQVNYNKLIISEMRESLSKIEKKLRTQAKVNVIQKEIEKIEVRHMEGKLNNANMSVFSGNNLILSPTKIIKSNKSKKKSKLNEINKGKSLLKNELLIKNSSFSKYNSRLNSINEDLVDNDSAAKVDKYNPLFKLKNTSFLNKNLEENVDDSNVMTKKSFINNMIMIDDEMSSNSNLTESSIEKEEPIIQAELNNSEVSLINQFILEEEINQNKQMKFMIKKLSSTIEEKDSGKNNKAADKAKDNNHLFGRRQFFLKKKNLKFDENTKTKLKYINFTADRLDRVMKIIYPDLMAKKQKLMNKEIENLKKFNKTLSEMNKTNSGFLKNTNSSDGVNNNKFISTKFSNFNKFDDNNSTTIYENNNLFNLKDYNKINSKKLILKEVERTSSVPRFISKLNQVEEFILKSKNYEEKIYNKNYLNNLPLISRIRLKMLS